MDKKSKKASRLIKSKVAIIGDGSWATALYNTISELDVELYWWVRLPEIKDFIKKYHGNPDFLRFLELHPTISHISTNVNEVVSKCDILLFAIPSPYLKDSLSSLSPRDLKNKIVVSAVKGIIPRTHQLISDFFSHTYKVPEDHFVFLTGPSHAEEVANKRMTYLTLASSSPAAIEAVKPLLDNHFIAIRESADVKGLEYASILKNIYAIAVGICHSLGYGDNFLAVLTSNAVREMKQFFTLASPANRDADSSGYLGDLMVTAFSQFSRNRTFGTMIGKGYSVKSALLELNMIPEGYFASQSFSNLLKHYPQARLPIVTTVYHILYAKADPQKEFRKLEAYLI
jgi:glycerol-3-phosphate dehydrogenase (NAD(P)+)